MMKHLLSKLTNLSNRSGGIRQEGTMQAKIATIGQLFNHEETKNSEAQRIEARLKECLAFIERVANWDFELQATLTGINDYEDEIFEAQEEAFKLLKGAGQ